MALGVTNLASTATTTDAVSFSLPSANYDANTLILVHISNSAVAGSAANPTLAGLTGATWSTVETYAFNTSASATQRNSVLRTMIGTSQNGAVITASFGGATQTGFAGIVTLITGSATSGTNGSGAIAQSTFLSTISATVSLTLPSVPSAAVMGFYTKGVNTSMGTPTGFTRTTDLGYATPAARAMGAFNLTPTQTWASTQTAVADCVVIGMEFVAQSAGTTPIIGTRRLLAGVGI